MKKIHSIELYNLKIVELENGEFADVKGDGKKYPLFITNKALQYGRDKGFIESSLIEDFLKILQSQQGSEMSEEDKNIAAIKSLNEDKAIKIIYLAYFGAAGQNAMSYEEFLEMYHLDFTETFQLYAELVKSTFKENKNRFATGLEKSVAPIKSNEKK